MSQTKEGTVFPINDNIMVYIFHTWLVRVLCGLLCHVDIVHGLLLCLHQNPYSINIIHQDDTCVPQLA